MSVLSLIRNTKKFFRVIGPTLHIVIDHVIFRGMLEVSFLHLREIVTTKSISHVPRLVTLQVPNSLSHIELVASMVCHTTRDDGKIKCHD